MKVTQSCSTVRKSDSGCGKVRAVSRLLKNHTAPDKNSTSGCRLKPALNDSGFPVRQRWHALLEHGHKPLDLLRCNRVSDIPPAGSALPWAVGSHNRLAPL